MRNGKRILSLALLVLLVVLLTPVAAHADPPKGDTHLHSWSVVSETPATCTAGHQDLAVLRLRRYLYRADLAAPWP